MLPGTDADAFPRETEPGENSRDKEWRHIVAFKQKNILKISRKKSMKVKKKL